MFISYFCINFIYVFPLFPEWNNLSKLKKRQKGAHKEIRMFEWSEVNKSQQTSGRSNSQMLVYDQSPK